MIANLTTSSTLNEWLDALALPAFLVDCSQADLPILVANRAWCLAHGYNNIGELTLSAYFSEPSCRNLLSNINELRSDTIGYRSIISESLHQPKEQGRWYRHSLSRLASERLQADAHLVLICEQDITWETLDESRLAQQAAVDPLTGLLAREPFLKKLRSTLLGLSEQQGAICLVFIDLDKFKPINDMYGHDVGDQVLSPLGDRLLGEMSPGNLAGRLGGDEFVLMLTGALNQEVIKDYLNSMVTRIFQPIQINTHLTLPISGSFGYVCTQDPQASVAELLKAADKAMYIGKQSAQSSAVIAGEIIESQQKSQSRLEFLQALKSDGLVMYIQPVISLRHKQVIGFEVLPRWQHPEYGMLDLERFPTMMVDSEEGKAFDRWLILTAAELSANFKRQGFDIGIGINLTRRQLDSGSFIEFMRESKPFFPDGRVDLTLEIIESPHFLDDALAFSALKQAREMGSQVVLDHFGSTKSSMAFAAKVPLDFIKLHDDVCHDLVANPERQHYARALIDFAHALNTLVVASGIGSQEDADILTALNCDLIQGNLWLKPMTVEQVTNQFLSNTQYSEFTLRRKK